MIWPQDAQPNIKAEWIGEQDSKGCFPRCPCLGQIGKCAVQLWMRYISGLRASARVGYEQFESHQRAPSARKHILYFSPPINITMAFALSSGALGASSLAARDSRCVTVQAGGPPCIDTEAASNAIAIGAREHSVRIRGQIEDGCMHRKHGALLRSDNVHGDNSCMMCKL